jgi:serine/threonine protein kinase
MSTCPTCRIDWPSDYSVCPDDGARLVAATAPTAALALAVAEPMVAELAPGTVVGEYRIERKIGQGGMGAVYGARHPLIGKRAAIKVISRELSVDPESVQRFVVEAQSVNQIGHPNIVDVFAFGTLPDGRSYFVMEWLNGRSLAARMREPVPLGEAQYIVDGVVRALEAAHTAGVVHRDLKPDNVFLVELPDEPPRVKLLDFGLAKLSTQDGGIARTRSGVVMGTPLYVSPEQARGAKVDARSDVYALGVILYELLTGTAPFVADSAVEIMAKHISEPVPPPMERCPDLAPELAGVLTSMMAKDPAARPTLRAVRSALASHAGSTALPPRWEPAVVWMESQREGGGNGSGNAVYPTPLPTSLSRRAPRGSRGNGKGRRVWGVVIAGVVAVSAVVVGVMVMSGGGKAKTERATGNGQRATGNGQSETETETETQTQTQTKPEAATGDRQQATGNRQLETETQPQPVAETPSMADAPDAGAPEKRARRKKVRATAGSGSGSAKVDVNAVHDPFSP